MARIVIRDLMDCLRIYYAYPEIGTKEIMRLFDVGESKAWSLKKPVQKKQVEEQIIVLDKSCVNTELAFKVWGIDIKDIERRIKKLEELGLYKSQEKEESED